MSVPPPIRVLLTEDVVADAELEVRELKRAGLRISHQIADNEESFTRALREFVPDIILSDFSMPAFDGMSALALARELRPETPFIFVSGTIGEEYAIRALKNGATDYVLKSNLVRLPAAVERALAEAKERRERLKIEAELGVARERLAGIINSLPDVLWSVELPSERILYIGPASRPVLGRDADDFLHDPGLWVEVMHPEDRPATLAAWRRLVDRGERFDVDYRVIHPDGSVRWVNSRGSPVRGRDGSADRIDGVARDITEQVEHRRRSERIGRIRDLLGALNAAIVRIRERRPLFDEICRFAVARGGFVQAIIIEVDAAGKASVAATTEDDPARFQSIVDRYNTDPVGETTLFAEAMRTGRPAVSNDIVNDSRVVNRAARTARGTAAMAFFPVFVERRLALLVSLRAREAGFFDEEELALLLEIVSNISFALELIDKQEQISYLALYDALTGLPNRTLFQDRLTQAIQAQPASDKRKLGLLLVDLERFKAINDALGRSLGDQVLKAVAGRLREFAGDITRVGRLGSNVYAMMLPGVTGPEEVARVLEQAPVFARSFYVDGREVRLAAKKGIAIYPDDGADADALLRNAEAALKRAKETGERYLFYAPQINARVSEQVDLEHRLRRAVEQRELFAHYQPKVDLASRAIIGLEALMRWYGPDGGLVSPAKFVPVLEQTGLIFEAGQQILAAASRTYRGWREKGLKAPRIAVNVSALQLRSRTFVEDVAKALGGSGADCGVDLEVTESLLMSDIDKSIRKLRALRDAGMRIALDDFGTGYSSLSYLSRLPLDALKIDRSFIHGMAEHADGTSIVTAIISLAQALRLKVIAEGVETEPQAQLLRLLRCDQAQGYLFSPPVPAEKVETLL